MPAAHPNPKVKSLAERDRIALNHSGLKPKHESKDEEEVSIEMKFGRLLGGGDAHKRHSTILKLRAYLTAKAEKVGLCELDLLKLHEALWYTHYLSDKVPVQQELARHIADLVFCFAGSAEEDSFAAELYLNLCLAEEEEEEGEDSSVDGDSVEDMVDMEEVEGMTPEMLARRLSDIAEVYDDDDDNDDGVDEDVSEEETDDEEMSSSSHDGEQEEGEEEDESLIPHCKGAHLASLFIRTFFIIMKRHWMKLDKHRVDKFYSLVRFVVNRMYGYMAMRNWNLGIIRLFNDAIYDEVLSQLPNGLRMHLIDICLDELAKYNGDVSSRNDSGAAVKVELPIDSDVLIGVMEPYLGMLQTVDDEVVHQRLMEGVLLKFLSKYSAVAPAPDDEEKDMRLHEVNVQNISDFVFELASAETTLDKYRESMYEMTKTYVRKMKDMDYDGGDDAENDEMKDIDDEEPVDEDPQQIAIEKTKKSKDKKKAKKRKMEASDDITEKEEDKEEVPITPVSGKKKHKLEESSSKKKTKVVVQVDETHQPGGASSTKKNRKKKSLESAKGMTPTKEEEEEEEIEKTIVVDTSNSSEKKKKKKNKKKSKEQVVEEGGEDNEEQVIIISQEEQVAAKMEALKKTKKKQIEPTVSDDSNASSTEERRVKFGKNRAKGYKASMKALRRSNPFDAEKTPDKKILKEPKYTPSEPPRRSSSNNRKSKKSSTGKKKKRKKASDFM